MPLLLWCGVAHAHALAPAGLDLTLVDPTHADVVWRTPVREPNGESLTPVWPAGCAFHGGDASADEAGALVVRGGLECGAPIVGSELRIEGLSGGSVDAVITVRGDAGRVRRVLLHGAVDRWEIAAPDPAPTPVRAAMSAAVAWASGARRVLVCALVAICVEVVVRARARASLRAVGYAVGILAIVVGWFG